MARRAWTIWTCPQCKRYTTDWKHGVDCDCDVRDWATVDVVPKAQADDLVKALRFYAEKDAWGPSDPHKGLPRVDLDEGDVARAALDAYETEDR